MQYKYSLMKSVPGRSKNEAEVRFQAAKPDQGLQSLQKGTFFKNIVGHSQEVHMVLYRGQYITWLQGRVLKDTEYIGKDKFDLKVNQCIFKVTSVIKT